MASTVIMYRGQANETFYASASSRRRRISSQPGSAVGIGEEDESEVALGEEEESAVLAGPVAAMLNDADTLGAGTELESLAHSVEFHEKCPT
jgi:hypothetical protein